MKNLFLSKQKCFQSVHSDTHNNYICGTMPLTPYTLQYISNLLSANAQINNPQLPVETLAIDSRKILSPEITLFFALKGQRNGHNFIPELINKGVKSFVISEDKWSEAYPGINFYWCLIHLKRYN